MTCMPIVYVYFFWLIVLTIVLQVNIIIIQFEVYSAINKLVRLYVELILWDYNNYVCVLVDHHLI